jgi:hypothetical protein
LNRFLLDLISKTVKLRILKVLKKRDYKKNVPRWIPRTKPYDPDKNIPLA